MSSVSELVIPDVFEGLRKYDSTTVSNAIEHFNVRDSATGFIRQRVGLPAVGCRSTDGWLCGDCYDRHNHVG